MKRGLVLFSLSVILLLSIGLVSAGWLNDFFAKVSGNAQITGQAVSGGTCTGTATPCSSFSKEDTCKLQQGCSWITSNQNLVTAAAISEGSCSGTATPCSSLTDGSTCNLQYGCTWTTETESCPSGYTCLNSNSSKIIVKLNEYTYEIELLSASDTAATIEVTAAGGQGIAMEINEEDTEEINGLNIYLKSADESNGFLRATLLFSYVHSPAEPCPEGYTCLNSSSSKTTLTFNNSNYEVELISASDTAATIEVTKGSTNVTKEISEGTSKEINGLNVYVKSADETNLQLSAVLKITAASSVASCTDSDGGKNYYLSGEVAASCYGDTCYPGGFNDYDYCITNSTLTEYFCEGNIANAIRYNCSNGCFDGACVKEVPENETEKGFFDNFKPVEQGLCDSGCLLDGKCYPYNNRKSGNYCSVDGTWQAQLADNSACENNFECGSNVCVSNQCIEGNVIQKIISWFNEVLAKKRPKVAS